MLLLTIQALGELAVLYPVNGAFFTYCVRFISPAWLVSQSLSTQAKLTDLVFIGALPLAGITPSDGLLFFPSSSQPLALQYSTGEMT
jgi:hypothetical protein